jgi:hypothetical protein
MLPRQFSWQKTVSGLLFVQEHPVYPWAVRRPEKGPLWKWPCPRQQATSPRADPGISGTFGNAPRLCRKTVVPRFWDGSPAGGSGFGPTSPHQLNDFGTWRSARRHLYRPELAGTSRRQHHDDLNVSPDSGRNATVPSGGRLMISPVLLDVFGRSTGGPSPTRRYTYTAPVGKFRANGFGL